MLGNSNGNAVFVLSLLARVDRHEAVTPRTQMHAQHGRKFSSSKTTRKSVGLIANGLSEAGQLVEVAADGVRGLEQATDASGRFDVMVLDLMLPKMDGFGVLAAMRGWGVRTPVLMLSAPDSVDDRVRGLRTGRGRLEHVSTG